MKFLHDIPPFVFFTGKEGNGKALLAYCTAVMLAEQGKKILLVSADTVFNIDQIFEQPIGSQITAISAVANLSAMAIDPNILAEQYRRRIIDSAKNILPANVVAGIEKQLSDICPAEIAVFNAFARLLTDYRTLGAFDHIIFDTTPTGHTIRVLQSCWTGSGFITDNLQSASCSDLLAGLDRQHQQYQGIVSALSDARQTRVILVTRAQKALLAEIAGIHEDLAASGINNQYLVINKVQEISLLHDNPLAKTSYSKEQQPPRNIPAVLDALPRDMLFPESLSLNIAGPEALRICLLKDGLKLLLFELNPYPL